MSLLDYSSNNFDDDYFFANNPYLTAYYNSFLWLDRHLKEISESGKIDYLLVLSRKTPRIIDYIIKYDLSDEIKRNKIITDRSLDYMGKQELEGKKIVIIDDIIISGTTIRNLLENLIKNFNVKSCIILVLAIDKDSINFDYNENSNIYIFKEPDLNKEVSIRFYQRLSIENRFLFSNEIINTFITLNKPYDIDFPILYGYVSKKKFNNLLEEHKSKFLIYSLTSAVCKDQNYLRYSLIPKNDSFYTQIFQKDFKNIIDLHIIKYRLYYSLEQEKLSIVPIMTFTFPSNNPNSQIFETANINIYNKDLNQFNIFINLIKKNYIHNNFSKALYRLITYTSNLIFGLLFLKNSNFFFKPFYKSSSLEEDNFSLEKRDIDYLFGQLIAKEIQNFFDRFNTDISNLSGFIHNQKLINKYKENYSENPIKDLIDQKFTKLNFLDNLNTLGTDLDKYITDNFNKFIPMADNIALIFVGLYLFLELRVQHYIKNNGSNGHEYERLQVGFNLYEIYEIMNYLYGKNETNLLIKISISLDYLIDQGICISIFNYNTANNFYERAYRYGELTPIAFKFEYFMDEVLKGVYDFLKSRFDTTAITQISFEKIMSYFYSEILSHHKDLNALTQTIDQNVIDINDEIDKKLTVTKEFSIHGAVLKVYPYVGKLSNNGIMIHDWCTERNLTKTDPKVGVCYSETGNKAFNYTKLLKILQKKEIKIVDPEIITKYESIGQLLILIDKTIDETSQNHYLIALTTCDTRANYILAIESEIEIFFNIYDEIGKSIKDDIKNNQEISEEHYRKFNLAFTALNGIALKHKLFDSYITIIDTIETNFMKNNYSIKKDYRAYLRESLLIARGTHNHTDTKEDSYFTTLFEVVGILSISLYEIYRDLIMIFREKAQNADIKKLFRDIRNFDNKKFIDIFNNIDKDKKQLVSLDELLKRVEKYNNDKNVVFNPNFIAFSEDGPQTFIDTETIIYYILIYDDNIDILENEYSNILNKKNWMDFKDDYLKKTIEQRLAEYKEEQARN